MLVGDQAQLGPQLMSHVAAHLGLGESLFGRLVRQGAQAFFLNTQFRMHPAIAAYPNKAFYQGRLGNGVNAHDRPPPQGYSWPKTTVHGVTPIVFLGVESSEQQVGTSRANRAEAAVVADAARRLLPHLPQGELAIITPYAAQAQDLRGILRDEERSGQKMTIATVDAFQGMEHDVIVVSTVRASLSAGAGFLSDPRRLNVLLTRARRGLLLVGHAATLLRDPAWAPLLRYMWREGLVQGEGLEPFQGLGASEGGDSFDTDNVAPTGKMIHSSIAPTYNNPSGPSTWLAWTPHGQENGSARQTPADRKAGTSGGGPNGPAAAPSVAYDWRKDLKEADKPPGADLVKEEAADASASVDPTAVKEEPEVKAAPPKRKKRIGL